MSLLDTRGVGPVDGARSTLLIQLRGFAVLAIALAAFGAGCGDDGDSSGAGNGGAGALNCPGVANSCPSGCEEWKLAELESSGCLAARTTVGCVAPDPNRGYTQDAGCAKRAADGVLFGTTQGGTLALEGWVECTPDEYGQIVQAWTNTSCP